MLIREHEAVTLCTLAYADDSPIEDGDDRYARAHLHCRVFIDGKELVCVLNATVRAGHGDFQILTLELSPSQLNIVSCTKQEWDALGQ